MNGGEARQRINLRDPSRPRTNTGPKTAGGKVAYIRMARDADPLRPVVHPDPANVVRHAGQSPRRAGRRKLIRSSGDRIGAEIGTDHPGAGGEVGRPGRVAGILAGASLGGRVGKGYR